MRLIDTQLINRIPCTRDPKYDVKEHALEFSTFVMNSQHSSMIACVPSLVFTEKCHSEFPKIFSFVIVVFVIFVVDDNVVVLAFRNYLKFKARIVLFYLCFSIVLSILF